MQIKVRNLFLFVESSGVSGSMAMLHVAGDNTLQRKLGISRQAIARQFPGKVGVSPKQYSRLIHFNEVQKFLNNHPSASWLDITYKFDYFDQSHLIKDFYHFTGTSPKGYAALDTFLVNNFALPDIDIKSF